MEIIAGGITAAKGFLAVGGEAGIKPNGKDLAMVVCQVPARVAAVFTTNRVQAAPVMWSRRIVLEGKPVRAVVINSGNANASTGSTGLEHAIAMAETAAQVIGVDAREVLVASTGVIGVPLPIERITKGIVTLFPQLAAGIEAGDSAAQAIRTTDTVSKQAAVRVEVDGHWVTIGGMAKGSGMIHPNMATLLGFITTDAAISKELLERALRSSVADSFHMISVDGDTSTNDTVAVLANGLAQNPEITQVGVAYDRFAAALHAVSLSLAKQIIRDGEGATKLVEVRVAGALSGQAARVLAKSVITSTLVKTALFGEDANWGRVLAALGYSGAEFNPAGVSIRFVSDAGEVRVMDEGEPVWFDEDLARQVLHPAEVLIEVQLADGPGQATAWGCDLSYEYVKINGEYRS
ncbi:bifunctional glutamate N-acetyltransferase/amino-acid acetyltransferase ArgJ [Alicyclobacillaceae bacterium I2511]|nr:bifunctional glutamate N-acetyltransferase/amino-acid acetyltransferase ArgJ [Alicyclobacillaceae bacterium I2511]